MNYLYKYGDIEVYNKFQQPTKQLFYKWREEFLQSNDLKNYNILFMGNTAEIIFGVSKLQTSDVDIILSGKIYSYKNLFKIMHSAFLIGLKYNLCIDIFHIDVDVFKIKWWDCYQQIRFYDTIETKKEKITLPDKIENLADGLYKFERNKKNTDSYLKHKTRLKSKDYLGLRFNLKTMELISFN